MQIGAHTISRRTLLLLVAVVVVLAGGAGIGGMSGTVPGMGAEERPPVVLISIDTMRADRLSAAGYERNITPNLDAFIRDAYYFERAYANAPWTLPSHATVFTGRYPSSTGALHLNYSLCNREKTIAERLNASGYRTVGFSGDGPVSKAWRFDQGFDVWDEKDSNLYGYTDTTFTGGNAEKAIRFLENRSTDRFFLFTHGFDVHAPYVVPRRDVRYGGNFSGGVPVTYADLERIRENNRTWVDARNELNLSSRQSPHIQQLEDLYDNSFIYMDRELGRIFSTLKEEGVYDDALIIVMSDHGEEFKEHGTLGHVQFYSETIRVPLAVKFPHQKTGEHVRRRVELRDIYPTILREVGIPVQSRGVSLQAIVAGSEHHETIFAERLEKKMVVKGQHKLIWNFGRPNEPQYELYNIGADPAEQHDLSDNRTLLRRINQSFNGFPRRTSKRCPPRYGKSFLQY